MDLSKIGRHRPIALLATLSAAFALVAGVSAVQQRPTFTVRSDLVQLDAVVLDRQRRPVSGLAAADFLVTDDGQPRPIDAFAEVTIPGAPPIESPGLVPMASTGVVSNQRANVGRLVVIMIDQSVPTGPMIETARRAARAAVDSLGPQDLAAVITAGSFGGDGTAQGFTSDHKRLYDAIARPFMGATKAPPNGTGGDDHVPSIKESIACYCGTCQWETIARIADAMRADVQRQKILIFIARELQVQVDAATDQCAFDVRYARERGLQALARANVTVYPIDPSGLETLARMAASAGCCYGNGQSAAQGVGQSLAEHLHRIDDLTVLADYTGGRAVFNTNDPDRLVPDLFQESSTYYAIGFRGDMIARRDPHKIRVSIRDRPDLTVRARSTYYAGAPDADTDAPKTSAPSDPLRAAVTSLLPDQALHLQLAATPTFLTSGETGINVLLGINGPTTPRKVALLLGVFDRFAKEISSSRTEAVPEPAPDGSGLIWRSYFPQKSGDYELRIGVRDSDQAGSVYGYVEVPDPGRALFALSGARLATNGQPTLQRRFSNGQPFSVWTELHGRTPLRKDAALTLAIVDSRGRNVREETHVVPIASFGAGNVADVRLDVPTHDLAAGRYVLRLMLKGGKPVPQDELAFDLE
jgi:VWFA-related protein